jgi:RNA-directed DNA polymerase
MQRKPYYKRNRAKEVKLSRMIEQVLNPRNVIRAYQRVRTNKGSAGVDGMSVMDLKNYLSDNREQIETKIRQGKYLPQAIRGG